MRVVHCILVTISQLTMFGLWKRVDSVSHTSGLSLVTSAAVPKSGSLWIRNSGLTTSYAGLVPIMVRAAAKGSVGVNNMNGLCRHPLGTGCTDAWI